MEKQIKKGISLSKNVTSHGNHTGWIAPCILSLIAFVSFVCILLEQTGLWKICDLSTILLTGVLLCVWHAALSKYKRYSLFYLGTLAGLLLVTFLFRTQITEGLFLCWNQMGDTWTASTGWVLQSFEVDISAQEKEQCLVVISCVIGTIGMISCCFLSAYAPKALAVLLPALLLGVGVIFGSDASAMGILLVLLSAMCLLIQRPIKETEDITRSISGWFLCGTAVCILLVFTTRPEVLSWSAKVSEQLHQELHKQKYETVHTTLPEGDFSDYTSANQVLSPALVVTMTNPEAMYLRGFTGCTFENDIWTSQDTRILAANENLLYWLNLNEFNPSAQFAAALPDSWQQSNIITVENVGACNRYMYVPFTLQETMYLQPMDLRTDSVVCESSQRVYTYSAVTGGDALISQLLDWLQTSNDHTAAQYRRAETAYREYVYQNYLALSEQTVAMLGKQWNNIISEHGYTKDLTLQQAQECTLAFLNRCFPEDGAAVNFTLPLNQAKGTSFQYATIAVLTLRYYGIPARYAEGYVISDESIAEMQDHVSITVDSSYAQAWAEVYLEGVGWLPISLVPGLGAARGIHSESQNQSESLSMNTEPELVDDPAESRTDDPLEQSWEEGSKAMAQMMVLWLFLLIVIFGLMLVIRRKILLHKKDQKFHARNMNDAIAWIFCDITLLLKQMGFDRGNASVMNLCRPIAEQLGQEYAQKLTKMIELNSEALFSRHHLGHSEWDAIWEFRNETLTHLKTRSDIGKRILIKWIYCLY